MRKLKKISLKELEKEAICLDESELRLYIDNMIRQLTRDSFLELENEKNNTYKVMSSWNYLERLIESINIYDDSQDDEKPE